MKEAIHSGIRKLLKKKTYDYFKRILHNGETFDPSVVWNALPDQSRDHFNHSLETMQIIDRMIEVEQKVLLAPAEPDPDSEGVLNDWEG
jgi:hypothetical protein